MNDVQPNLGSRAESLLCLPIRNSEDDVIGVALVINKVTGATFSADDEKVRKYIGLHCKGVDYLGEVD